MVQLEFEIIYLFLKQSDLIQTLLVLELKRLQLIDVLSCLLQLSI